MNKKKRIYIILTGGVAITLIWLSQSNKNSNFDLNLPSNENISKNTSGEKVSALEGVLWPSDDELNGNLMLVNDNTTVYIKSSRDFSDLIGKSVIVSIDGTLDNFTLLNMEENLAKGGFIKVQ